MSFIRGHCQALVVQNEPCRYLTSHFKFLNVKYVKHCHFLSKNASSFLQFAMQKLVIIFWCMTIHSFYRKVCNVQIPTFIWFLTVQLCTDHLYSDCIVLTSWDTTGLNKSDAYYLLFVTVQLSVAVCIKFMQIKSEL